MWQMREGYDGWWEVYSSALPDFIYAKCPTQGQAWMICGLMNGGIQIR